MPRSLLVAGFVFAAFAGGARADEWTDWGGRRDKPGGGVMWSDDVPPGVPPSSSHDCECGSCVHPKVSAEGVSSLWVHKKETGWFWTDPERRYYWTGDESYAWSRAAQLKSTKNFGGEWSVKVVFQAIVDHDDKPPHSCGQFVEVLEYTLKWYYGPDRITSTTSYTQGGGLTVKLKQSQKEGAGTEVGASADWSTTGGATVSGSGTWVPTGEWKTMGPCWCGKAKPAAGPTSPPGPSGPSGPTAPTRPTSAATTYPPGPTPTGPTGPTAPTGPGTKPAGDTGGGGTGPGKDAPTGPTAPAGPATPDGPGGFTEPKPPPLRPVPRAPTEPPTYTMAPVVNAGTIGAGDSFSTAITVKDAATAEAIKAGLRGGEMVMTQNGVPVQSEVIATPQHVAAFDQNPATTVYVKSTVLPARDREVRIGLEKRTDAGTTEVMGSTTMLTQSRAAIFQDPASGEVKVVVTGTDTPWGDADPQFELHPRSDPSAVGTPADIAAKQGEGSTVWSVLKAAGWTIVSVGAGVAVATMVGGGSGGSSKGGGGQTANPPARPIPPTATTSAGTTPGQFVDTINTAYSTTAHNSIPTGQTATADKPAITNIAGSSAIVPNPKLNKEVAGETPSFIAAVSPGDVIKVKIAKPAQWEPVPSPWSLDVVEDGLNVGQLPVLSAVETAEGYTLTAEVGEYLFGSADDLWLVAKIGSVSTAPVPITTVLKATPLSAAESTTMGGTVIIDVRITGAGSEDQWIATKSSDSPSVVGVPDVEWGEGSGIFKMSFQGQMVGVANVRIAVRRAD